MNISEKQGMLRPLYSVGATTKQAPLAQVKETPPALKDPTESAQISNYNTTSEVPTETGKTETKSDGWLSSLGESASKWANTLVLGPAGVAISAVSDVWNEKVRDSHFLHKVDCGSEDCAKKKFSEVKDRLLNPNSWVNFGPKLAPTSFTVYDGKEKKAKDGPPGEGDFLRIKLPDPGPPVWVKIEKLEVGEDSAKVVVRPSENPTSNSPTVIHLFDEETTNTFKVQREGSTVSASVSGDNERTNRSGNLFQRAFAGARTAGAWMGAKVPQWNSFTRKIVEGPETQQGQRLTGAQTGLMTALDALQSGKGN